MKLGAFVVKCVCFEGEDFIVVKKARIFLYRSSQDYINKVNNIMQNYQKLNFDNKIFEVIDDARNLRCTHYSLKACSESFYLQTHNRIEAEWFRWIQTLS